MRIIITRRKDNGQRTIDARAYKCGHEMCIVAGRGTENHEIDEREIASWTK